MLTDLYGSKSNQVVFDYFPMVLFNGYVNHGIKKPEFLFLNLSNLSCLLLSLYVYAFTLYFFYDLSSFLVNTSLL